VNLRFEQSKSGGLCRLGAILWRFHLALRSRPMRLERTLIVVLSIALITSLAGADKKTTRRYLKADPLPGSTQSPPFSRAVLDNDTLYIAGDIGLDPKTGKPGETPEAEAKLVLDSVQSTLKEAGMTMDDLVWVQVFCSDVSHFGAWNSVYRQYFKGELPARAFLGSGKLLFNARFEINAIAVKH
jgi:2-iminobutanoate/2-iminopropanoate deaminase